jgi:hypothetical protein
MDTAGGPECGKLKRIERPYSSRCSSAANVTPSLNGGATLAEALNGGI